MTNPIIFWEIKKSQTLLSFLFFCFSVTGNLGASVLKEHLIQKGQYPFVKKEN